MKECWYAFLALIGYPSIVQFRDGKFGCRRGIVIRGYLDLRYKGETPLWWYRSDRHFCDCVGTLEEVATAMATRKKPRRDRGSLVALKFLNPKE